jgi:hypothetical protein
MPYLQLRVTVVFLRTLPLLGTLSHPRRSLYQLQPPDFILQLIAGDARRRRDRSVGRNSGVPGKKLGPRFLTIRQFIALLGMLLSF